MTLPYDQIDLTAVATPYREHVRQVIPEDIQEAIRAECTDKPIPGRALVLFLPATCDLDIPADRFAAAATGLRAHRTLVGELRWHRAAVAAFLENLHTVETQTKQLQTAIDRT